MDIFKYESKNYLAMSDFYSRYLDICSLKNKTAKEVITNITKSFSHQGIPKEIVADNVPFDSFEFRNFCNSYDINLTTSSPTYSQSNGFAEKAVGIAKGLIKKCKDSNTELWLALLEYRNTPLRDVNASPVEILMSRKTRTLLPEREDLFKPNIVPNINPNIEAKNNRNKFFYDRNAKFSEGFAAEDVWFRDSKRGWLKAIIASKSTTPRSYWIKVNNGSVLRRNSNVLRKRVI